MDLFSPSSSSPLAWDRKEGEEGEIWRERRGGEDPSAGEAAAVKKERSFPLFLKMNGFILPEKS